MQNKLNFVKNSRISSYNTYYVIERRVILWKIKKKSQNNLKD